MRLIGMLAAAAVIAMSASAASAAAVHTSGAFSAFHGKVSCHWQDVSGNARVRCWALADRSSYSQLRGTSAHGVLGTRNWTAPVGAGIGFNNHRTLPGGVSCAFRWFAVTDTHKLKSVVCTSTKGGRIFANPSGVSAD
jgi:opacity protein-like surface antigen